MMLTFINNMIVSNPDTMSALAINLTLTIPFY